MADSRHKNSHKHCLPDYSNQTAMRFQTHGAAEEWQGWKTVNQNRQAQSLPAIVYHGKGMPMTW
ncbi:hypothetical protein BGI36_00115 [Snodgrassella communis]|uniref:hypothetical protein n=1 Tax=Snodgrassella communis TaxID=2946699 RepID=UPI000C1E1476|nr:hypothetical protein [Snodgrassella communis]PIT24318.1 hypothetical protein BGI36_00115 [Snodgrassella communis]